MKRSDSMDLTGTLGEDYKLLLDFSSNEGFRRILNRYKDKKLLITVEEFERKRSNSQNRYYWGVAVVCIKAFLKETEGKTYTQDEVHCYNLFNVVNDKPQIKEVYGVQTIVMTTKSTSKMNTKEFVQFIEELQAYWALKGCYIPDPREDNLTSDFIEHGQEEINTDINRVNTRTTSSGTTRRF
jgi:hypothetical protein